MNSTTIAGKRITMEQVIVKHTFPNLGASKPTDFSLEGSQILLGPTSRAPKRSGCVRPS